MKQKIIQQGAEAKIILKDNQIIKDRIKKSYRLKELDEKIRKRRTKKEAKLLEKSSKIIFVPKIIKCDLKNKNIIMEFIKGKKLSEHLEKLATKQQEQTCLKIGMQIASLHDADIIHGDLTTSNMILDKENNLFFIDFGLGFHSHRIEDKAVDLHLIKQALEAKHYKNYKKFYKHILQGYKQSKNYKKTLNQLKKVESRGRYKKH